MKKLLLILLLFALSNGSAQQWKNWNTSNSLIPTDGIYSVATDFIGNVWMATNSGLIKFDGLNWIIYNTLNSPMNSNICYEVATDSNIVWVASNGGLLSFDGDSAWTIYDSGNSTLGSMNVTSVSIDRMHRKWASSWLNLSIRAPLSMLSDTVWRSYPQTATHPYTAGVSNVFTDKAGLIWMPGGGPNSGLLTLDDTTWSSYNTGNSTIPTNIIGSIIEDDSLSGLYMIGTGDKGLLLFDKTANTFIVFDTSNILPFNFIWDLKLGVNNSKWFISQEYPGTGVSSIGCYKNNTWTFFDTSNVGSYLFYSNSISISKENSSVWVGTSNGLAFYGDTLKLGNRTISKVQETFKTMIYPNPADNYITLSILQNHHTPFEICVFSIEGKLQQHFNFEPTSYQSLLNINTENLVNGIYLLQINNGERLKINKLIINH